MSKVYISPEDSLQSDEINNSFRSANLDSLSQKQSNVFASWLIACEPALKSRYLEYQQGQVNYFSILLLLLYSCVTIYRSNQLYHSSPSPLSLTNFLVSVILVVFVALVSNVLRLLRLLPGFHDKVSLHVLTFLDTCWLFGFNLWFSLTVVLSAWSGPCSRNREIIGCNSFYDRLDNDKIVCLLMWPVITYLIIRGAKWEMVIFSYLMNIATILTSIFRFDMESSLTTFVIVIPISTLALFEYQRQIVSVFMLSIKQEAMQEENDRLAEEAHSTELRHMIGNVAHDLKTPLSAFVCGVDTIKTTAEEIQSSLSSQEPLDRAILSTRIFSILENAVNVINTNSFMLMTINRCIDYTKASKNMKLTPRLETINLQEAINLPMHCMKDLQSDKVHISAMPLSKAIAPFIITDKQWLQENILCLLSNAVKYSSRGTVMLSVTLITKPFETGGVSGSNKERTVAASSCADGVSEVIPFSTDASVMEEKSADSEGIDDDTLLPKVLRVEVEDTGIGLTEEVMSNLFKPFKQAQRLAGGTGLGLFSLAKRMEALGGLYGVMKRRDGQEGSIFWFEIPYRPDTEATKNLYLKSRSDDLMSLPCSPRIVVKPTNEVGNSLSTKILSHSSSKDSTSQKEGVLTILVVDDSPSILKMSSKMLEKQGHIIKTAEDGAQALEAVTSARRSQQRNGSSGGRRGSGGQHAFDVVLMDLQMPVMDGLEATKRIRKFESRCAEEGALSSGRGLIIIGVSANSDAETVNDAYKAGVDAFIPKPFNFKLFDEVYQGVCERRKLMSFDANF